MRNLARWMMVAVQLLLAAALAPVMRADGLQQDRCGTLTIVNSKGQVAGICPLKHTDVVADIAGLGARVTVTQEFRNPGKHPVEAVYTFPLPDDAAVDSMTMQVGSRTIRGKILRREEARQVYEAARNRGQAASLLDQERPNVFTQSVANIMPGDRVLITITYVNLLKFEDGRYEFTFPMVVGPRYHASPAGAVLDDLGTTSTVTDAHRVSPPMMPSGTRAGHDISVQVHLNACLPIRQLKSIQHQVDIRQAGNQADVKLRDSDSIPNKDFVLRFSIAGDTVEEGLAAHSADDASGSGWFTLVVQPPAAPVPSQVSRKEMVFVLDQTGSQNGWPIEQSKATLRYCLKNLRQGDTFQVLGFNTEVRPCFAGAVPANAANVQKAMDFIAPLKGDGGTDILKAAAAALKMPDDPDRLRIVCYMTDGFVGNDMQILDYVRKNCGRARMFPIGIGSSVNRFLLEGMAREGRGSADYILRDGATEAASARFARRIASPLLLNVSVDWGRLPVEELYPKALPDLFSSAPIVVKGRYTHAARGPITIRGLLRGKPWSRTIEVNLPGAGAEGPAIRTIWARDRIEDLQSSDYLNQQRGRPEPRVVDQIVETSLKYGIMSQHTSFVAVEERVVNVGGKQQRVDVPVEMPDGVTMAGDTEAESLSRTSFGFASSAALPALRMKIAPAPAGGAAFGRPSTGLGAYGAGPIAGKRAKVAGGVTLSEDKSGGAHAVSPAQRLKVQRAAKLAPELLKATGTTPLMVKVWFDGSDARALARLQAAGLKGATVLIKGSLLLGQVTPAMLDRLVALDCVKRIEPARLR